MTFAPKKRTSKSKTRIRTTAWRKANAKRILNQTKLVYDDQGEAIALSHMVSPITGEYKGRKVVRTWGGKKPKVIRA